MLKDYYHDITAFGSLPFALFVSFLPLAFDNSNLTFRLLAALALCYVISVPIKLYFFKHRPNRQSFRNILEKFDAASFPSVHSMRASALGMTLIFYFDLILLSFIILCLIVAVMLSRILLKKHYWIDVIVGAVIGGAIPLFIPYVLGVFF